MQLRSPTPVFQSIRRNTDLRKDRIHDAYQMVAKPAEPTVCSKCRAVFHRGRWQWGKSPLGAHTVVCSACHRIEDRIPAGFVSIGGDYFGKHRDEVLGIVRNREAKERAEHPMARIIDIEEKPGGALVTTTDVHLARSLGRALLHACQGELSFRYHRAENLLRVSWER